MATVSDGAPAGAVAAAKAYLRIASDAEDAVIATLVGAAIEVCEGFTGLTLLSAERHETVAADGGWRRLAATPVAAIVAVTGADGAPLPVGGYAIDIDAGGDGWVRAVGTVRVTYVAGVAADWAGCPAALRQGVVRLAGHMHAHRDAADDRGPPAAVAALWRPWRRMRLS